MRNIIRTYRIVEKRSQKFSFSKPLHALQLEQRMGVLKNEGNKLLPTYLFRQWRRLNKILQVQTDQSSLDKKYISAAMLLENPFV